MKRIPKAVIAFSIIGAVIVAAMFLLSPRIAPVADTPDPAVVEQAAVTPEKTNELPEPPAQSQATLEEKMQKYNSRWFANDYKIEFNQAGDPVAVGTFVDIDIDRSWRENSISITSISPQPECRVAQIETSFTLDDENSGTFQLGDEGQGPAGTGRIFFRNGQITVEIQLDTAEAGAWKTFSGSRAFIQNGPQPLSFKDLKLGKASLGMSYEQAIQGFPRLEKEEGERKNYIWDMFFEDGTEVTMFDTRVYRIAVERDAYPTPRGIKVGDTKEQVARVYGPPADVYGDYWEYGPGSSHISFGFKEGKVSVIEVWLRFD